MRLLLYFTTTGLKWIYAESENQMLDHKDAIWTSRWRLEERLQLLLCFTATRLKCIYGDIMWKIVSYARRYRAFIRPSRVEFPLAGKFFWGGAGVFCHPAQKIGFNLVNSETKYS